MKWTNQFFRHFETPLGLYLTPIKPQTLPNAQLIGWSDSCAQAIGVDKNSFDWTAIMSGGDLPTQAQCCATVYSGHQFGVWAGQLGDGRAMLLGQVETGAGSFELQLKGAGKTPYSRGADGLAVLRSSIREFLCSEAMAGLGIPTTRALALLGSTKSVIREELETAAVVLRTAPSFIRFGHFEHYAAKGDTGALQKLADFVIEQYYPVAAELPAGSPARYACLLDLVGQKTAAMVAQWQGVGFCHGVMNTDNMSILGLTIDYGPFGFLDAFDAHHVCNHSDEQGRYAYANQAQVAHWNLGCLAQSLSLLVSDHDPLVDALKNYAQTFNRLHTEVFLKKLGLPIDFEGAHQCVSQTLQCLHEAKADMTQFFRQLSHSVVTGDYGAVRDVCIDTLVFDAWLVHYKQWIAKDTGNSADRSLKMLGCNPKYVLRNHLAETAIRKARDEADYSEIERLLKVLSHPYDEQEEFDSYAALPPVWAQQLSVSCSS